MKDKNGLQYDFKILTSINSPQVVTEGNYKKLVLPLQIFGDS